MAALTKTEACSCNNTWFTDEDGTAEVPACVCPIAALFANHLYWTLPESRRGAFVGIERALCGTKTDDHDELLRRMWAIFAAAMRVNGTARWDASYKEQTLLERIDAKRYTKDFDVYVLALAENSCTSVTKGGPVSAWLALDDLSDLLVSIEARR